MLIASNRLAGATINRDPCLSTWANFALMATAASFSPNIMFCGGNAIFQATVMPMSFGDEPDTPLYAPTIGPCIFPLGIPTILLNGIPAISLLIPSISNAGNATAGAVLIPSVVNVLMLYDETGAGTELQGRVSETEMTHASAALQMRGGAAVRHQLTEEGVGLVTIEVFSSSAAAALHGAIDRLSEQGARALVIDVRNNPGGDVSSAIEAAGSFLPAGALIATLVDADGDETDVSARAGDVCTLPLVVLVNESTASSAELFAGALQAHGRAAVFGRHTVGKGVAQRIVDARDGRGPVWESFATLRLPDGRPLSDGIVPDVDWGA